MRVIILTVLLLGLTACASGEIKQTKIERISAEDLAKILPAPIATLSLDEIVAMSGAGKAPGEIIANIKSSQSRYDLSTAQTLDLSKQGVATEVLTYINESNVLAKQNAIAEEMNQRTKERAQAEKILKRERDMAQQRYYDPFYYGSLYSGSFYSDPFFGPIGPVPYGFGHPRFRHRYFDPRLGGRYGW